MALCQKLETWGAVYITPACGLLQMNRTPCETANLMRQAVYILQFFHEPNMPRAYRFLDRKSKWTQLAAKFKHKIGKAARQHSH